MKPKYYSCFFLSLFACDQVNIEVNNEKAQDVDPKGNLLNVDSSIIDVVNNLCEGVKDINDKNNSSAYVELTTKLVGEYANSFWSLGRCQGIVKQICEQVPSYPSQIVYDVLYALVKNKCLDAVGVQTIIQGIKEDNPKVFSLLNNYVEKKFKTCNQGTDDSTRIIAESFGFIFNNTIFIPGIKTFTSTPIPSPKTKITVDNLTDISKCVRFIKMNGFDKTSLQHLIKLASSGDFNEAIKAIAGARIFFTGKGDDMMKEFNEKNVNLNDEGLQALANCIDSGKKIATTAKLKLLIPSLKNCRDLTPIFNKCKNDDVKVDGDFLSELAEKCPKNYDDLIASIPPERFNKKANKTKDGYLTFLQKYKNVNKEGLSPLFSRLPNFFPVADFITLLKTIDLDSATSLDTLIESLQGKKFDLKCLKKLVQEYNEDSAIFNKVLSKISTNNFDENTDGSNVINVFTFKDIQLNGGNLIKILSMINDTTKISDYKKAIDFCCQNIENLNDENMKAVFYKVTDDKKFDLNVLKHLWGKGEGKFNQILPCIPDQKLKKDNDGDDVIYNIKRTKINLNTKTLPNVLSMLDGGSKITKNKNDDVFQICCDSEFDAEDIDKILKKCDDDFKFGLKCLKLYKNNNHDRFNTVLAAIPQKNFDTTNKIDNVLKEIKGNGIDFIKGNLRKVLLLCKENPETITNVANLYFVFSRSCDDADGVQDLIDLVKNDSLDGNSFIKAIDDNAAKADAQKAFVEKFYSKIKNKSIEVSRNSVDHFIRFAFYLYKIGKIDGLNNMLKEDEGKGRRNRRNINMLKTRSLSAVLKDVANINDFKTTLEKALDCNGLLQA